MWQRWVVFFYSHTKKNQNKKPQVIGLKHHSKPNRLSEHFRAASICSIWIFAFLAATWLMWLKRLKKKIVFLLIMPAFQHSWYFVVPLDMVHFSNSKPLITNFIAFTCFRLKVQWIPQKQGNDKIFFASLLIMNSSMILPTISLGRIFTHLFFSWLHTKQSSWKMKLIIIFFINIQRYIRTTKKINKEGIITEILMYV